MTVGEMKTLAMERFGELRGLVPGLVSEWGDYNTKLSVANLATGRAIVICQCPRPDIGQESVMLASGQVARAVAYLNGEIGEKP